MTYDIAAQLQLLLKLQTVDSERDRLTLLREQLTGQNQITDLGCRADALSRALDASREELDDIRRKAKYWEQEANAMRNESAGLEQRMYGGEISNIKELSQTEKKVSSLRSRASELEDKVLGVFDDIEGREADISAREQDLTDLRDELGTAAEDLTHQLAEIDRQLGLLAGKRSELVPTVDAGLLARYEHMRSRTAGVAAAAMRAGSCTACRVKVPVILAQKVTRGEAVVQCENCGRILVPAGQ